MKKKYKNYIIIITILILMITSLVNSKYLIYQVLEYTNLFITKLFPATFIFFILSSLLINYGFIELISKILHINGASFYVILMSMISGFPSGSKYIKELLDNNKIDISTANYLISFTHFPNPLFVLGTVNIIIKSTHLSYLILISIILSNLIIGIILKKKSKSKIPPTVKTEYNSFSNYLTKAINSSIKTIILIYGTSLFFFLISVYIIKYLNAPPIINVLINGFFDLTKGVASAATINNNILKCILIITFISFGGISINMQVKSIIENTNISYKNFLIGRIYQVIISNAIFILLYSFY